MIEGVKLLKLSTKGRYGLRAMVDLAVYSNESHIALNNIAERQGISINYLEQVFAILKKSGLVKSIKGPQGGYILADIPDNISTGDILRALEGKLTVMSDDTEIQENSIQKCIKINIWDKTNACLNEVVDSITLGDLAGNYKK